MRCPLQETLVQFASSFSLAFTTLKVNVRLPDDLGHVERLLHGKLKDAADTLKVFECTFNLGPLDPCGRERRVVLSVSWLLNTAVDILTVRKRSYRARTRSNSRSLISSSM